MPKVNPTNINNHKKRSIINSQSTGYIATAGVGLAAYSGITKNKFLRKNHGIIAGISLLTVLAHIYFVLAQRAQYKSNKTA
ncbi:MAG: hypothetical protein PHC64_08960 [Candidatus Gastranaerophilales bacterium]|nr:hypothetical protein [Candidatus Gastranaerophilales bacterium]